MYPVTLAHSLTAISLSSALLTVDLPFPPPFANTSYHHCAVARREGSYAKQQQVATKLNKAQPSARHAWWIILSIMLQARAAKRGDLTSALDPNKLVQLAESMVSRQVAKDGKLDGFEGLLVYLDLLVAQGRWTEAAGAVTGPLGDAAAMAAERAHLRAALSMACGDTAAAAAALQEQLRSNPDDWATLQLYCDCVLRPNQDQASGSTTTTASSSAADVAAAGAPPPPLPHPARGWPESTLLRLSGGLAELLPKLPPEGVLPPPQTPEEQRHGLEAAQETVRQLVELVEAPAEAGTKLTTRGPYLAAVRNGTRAQRCWEGGRVLRRWAWDLLGLTTGVVRFEAGQVPWTQRTAMPCLAPCMRELRELCSVSLLLAAARTGRDGAAGRTTRPHTAPGSCRGGAVLRPQPWPPCQLCAGPAPLHLTHGGRRGRMAGAAPIGARRWAARRWHVERRRRRQQRFARGGEWGFGFEPAPSRAEGAGEGCAHLGVLSAAAGRLGAAAAV